MSLDDATLDLLRQSHPAWRLLRSDHAPLVASFLHRTFVAQLPTEFADQRNRVAVPAVHHAQAARCRLVVSPEFPVFTVNTDAVLPDVLDIYFRTPSIWPELSALSGGTNLRRRRLQPSTYLAYEMPLPPMPIQRKGQELNRRIAALKSRHAALREANVALLPATLERVFSGTA